MPSQLEGLLELLYRDRWR